MPHKEATTLLTDQVRTITLLQEVRIITLNLLLTPEEVLATPIPTDVVLLTITTLLTEEVHLTTTTEVALPPEVLAHEATTLILEEEDPQVVIAEEEGVNNSIN